MTRLDPNIVLQQVEHLKLLFPDIWDDGDEKLLADCVQAETDVFEFLAVVVDRMRDSASMAGGIAGRIAELELRLQRFERREKAMRTLCFHIMQRTELKKAELAEVTLSIRNGTPKVIITNEADVPDIYCRIKKEPDKTKIKELLTTNSSPVSWATMSNGEPALSVRTR